MIRSLAIIPIIVSGAHGETSVRAIYEDVRIAAAHRPELALISEDELFAVADNASKAIADCGANKACIAEKLRSWRAELGLVVVVNQIFDPPLVSLILVDPSREVPLAEEAALLAADEPTISAALRARAARLFEANGSRQGGVLRVSAMPAGAFVAIDGAIGGAERDVLPGAHRVEVSLDGYESAVRTVEVAARAEARVDITLMPRAAAEPSIVDSPWFWAGVGAAAMAGAVIVVLATRPGPCFCVPNPDGSGCGC